MEEGKRLAGNISWSFMAKMSAMVLFFLADILAARILGVEQYAQWSVFYAVLTMLFYLEWFGVNASTKVHISKAENAADRRAVLQAGLTLRTRVSLVISAGILAGGQLLFFLPAARPLMEKYPQIRLLALTAPVIAFLNSYAEFYKEVCIGLMAYAGLFAVTAAEYGGYLLFGTFGAWASRNALGVAAGYIITGVLVFFGGRELLGRLLRRIQQEETVSADTAGVSARERTAHSGIMSRTERMRQIFSYAVPLALIGIGGMILTEMDTVMLGVFSDKSQVASYAIAKQICTKASHINNILATGTLTVFSVIQRSEYAFRRRQFRKLSLYNLLLTGAAAAALFVLGGPVIRILYSGDYAQAGSIIRWLSFYYLLYGISAFYALFLDFREKAGARSIFYGLMILLNLVGNALLIPRFGAAGAAVASGAALVPYTAYVVIASYAGVWAQLKRRFS